MTTDIEVMAVVRKRQKDLKGEIDMLRDHLAEREAELKVYEKIVRETEEAVGNLPEEAVLVVREGAYRNMRMGEAILDALSNNPDGLSIPELQDLLLTGGVHTRSKDLYSTLYVVCRQLEKQDELYSEKRGKRKVYFLARKRGAK